MSDTIRLSGVTVNAPDAIALARFYAVVTGGVAKGNSRWASVTGTNGYIAFQQVDDFRAPVWPAGSSPMQMHLDFFVDDLAATGARVLAAGAIRFDFQPNSDHCFVYADPVGHPFCLSTWDGAQIDLETERARSSAAHIPNIPICRDPSAGSFRLTPHRDWRAGGGWVKASPAQRTDLATAKVWRSHGLHLNSYAETYARRPTTQSDEGLSLGLVRNRSVKMRITDANHSGVRLRLMRYTVASFDG